MANTTERYLGKTDAAEVFQTVKAYILAHSGGGGGGVGGSDPDGTTVINGNVITLTYAGGVRTTTFSNDGNTITEEDVKTGATTKTVKTTVINGNTITQTTTTVPV